MVRISQSTVVAGALAFGLVACTHSKTVAPAGPASSEIAPGESKAASAPAEVADGFKYVTGDRFGDSAILRYQAPGFEGLSLQQKVLLFHLSEAALSGRDIIYDQKHRYNLAIRRTVEALLNHGRLAEDSTKYRQLLRYAKQVWFARGIHHDYSKDKFLPEFSQQWFTTAVNGLDDAHLPVGDGVSKKELLARIVPVMFDPAIDAKAVNKAEGADIVRDSANNFYDPGVTADEARAFYAAQSKGAGKRPVSFGLNSKLVRRDGKLEERVWKVGGMYSPAIEKIVESLEKAIPYAETPEQKTSLERLVAYYKSGALADFDAYNIAWVRDTEASVDTINGFIEVYGDTLAYKGSFEGVVSFRDPEATKRISALADQAQWFEDHTPYLPAHKKPKVKGISAKVITVVAESGDAAPTTPIGINLPNSNWIRAEHGSKSVSIGNIIHAYNAARASGGALEEFCASEEERQRAVKYGTIAQDLLVDLHEVIGHASGQLEPGVKTPKETLRSYSSTWEEARADLVALWFIADPKLRELGLSPSDEVGKAAYDRYIRNGLLNQLNRIRLGNDIEEAHMRNRQMIAAWVYDKGQPDNVIERVERDGKTFFVIRDYAKLRKLFGELLREVQRVKSQGDYRVAKGLIEKYGVEVDRATHEEVLARYAKLDLPSYYGFIQPKLTPVERDGEIVDVTISYPEDFAEQQLEYAEKYSFLPTFN